ncbi:transposase [Mycoplasmopsis cynos]|uniref:Uncharacterized protein n=1 Tax=Mycoplasmopsis cynos TaxID=171284 RepID=A0A449AHF4_9BACT|nr:transposase [Mycoplasmopsis cynos]VEU64448.1 Uncharacterised protein [Mycoplasmopsis cynos]
MIYSDKRRTFWGNENNQTTFEKILNEKGIEIKCSSSPTHKPYVERSFRTALGKYQVYIDKNNLKNLNDLRLNSDGFRDYYNTRNNKLISKHNVFNQEGKKNGNWAIDLVINRKVLNGVVRYNNKNSTAFNLENKRLFFLLILMFY